MAKWYWGGQAATSGKVCRTYHNVNIIKTQCQNIPPCLFEFLLGLSGQVISAAKEDIIKAYYPGYFMQSVENQIQTKQVKAEHDDSYQGEK